VNIAAGSGLRPVTIVHFTEPKNIIYLYPKNDSVSGEVTISHVVEIVSERFKSLVINSDIEVCSETTLINERDFIITSRELRKTV
jgi:hypothetical protein